MYMYMYIVQYTHVHVHVLIHNYTYMCMYIVQYTHVHVHVHCYKVISNHSTTQVKRKKQLYENGVGKMIVGHSKM